MQSVGLAVVGYSKSMRSESFYCGIVSGQKCNKRSGENKVQNEQVIKDDRQLNPETFPRLRMSNVCHRN